MERGKKHLLYIWQSKKNVFLISNRHNNIGKELLDELQIKWWLFLTNRKVVTEGLAAADAQMAAMKVTKNKSWKLNFILLYI